jgi:uncharacterized membrane protein YheB (UPF0754 family)
MKIENGFLYLDKKDVLEVLNNNTDNESKEIDKKLIGIVEKYFNTLSEKQEKWLSEKIKYIIRHNTDYKIFKKLDIELVKEGIEK